MQETPGTVEHSVSPVLNLGNKAPHGCMDESCYQLESGHLAPELIVLFLVRYCYHRLGVQHCRAFTSMFPGPIPLANPSTLVAV
jgi:hypothetical protein